MGIKKQQDEIFPTSMAAYRWLRENNWKISLEPFWRHGLAGKWHREKDGKTVKRSVILDYAKTHLKKLDGEGVVPTDLQKEKLEAEAKKLKAQAEHWHTKTEVEKGNLVPKDEFERALAKRALVFKTDLLSFARGQAPVVVRMVGGKNEAVPELIEYLVEQFEGMLGRYADNSELKG